MTSWVEGVIAADNNVEWVIHRVTLVGALGNAAIYSIADRVDDQIVVNLTEGWVHDERGDTVVERSVSDRVLLVLSRCSSD